MEVKSALQPKRESVRRESGSWANQAHVVGESLSNVGVNAAILDMDGDSVAGSWGEP